MSNEINIENVILEPTMSFNDIVALISKSCKEEDNANSLVSIQFHGKGLSTDTIIQIYSYLLENLEQIHNSCLVMNIMSILKSYNTFDNSYFSDDRIFISSISQMLDVKLALKDKIDIASGKIADYFISLFRSANKFEYTMLDSYIDLPPFYNMLFMTYDLQSICTIMSNVKQDHQYKHISIRNAYIYLGHLAKTYIATTDLVQSFLLQKGIQLT